MISAALIFDPASLCVPGFFWCQKKKLRDGATARYPAEQEHIIRNTGKTEAKAVLVVVHR